VLHGIDLEVQQGKWWRSSVPAAGKTTLLRSINLLEQPESGTIRVGDVTIDAARSINQQKAAIRRLRQHVGFVFQNLICSPIVR
jgi:cystine transport system ATP-binding protein